MSFRRRNRKIVQNVVRQTHVKEGGSSAAVLVVVLVPNEMTKNENVFTLHKGPFK